MFIYSIIVGVNLTYVFTSFGNKGYDYNVVHSGANIYFKNMQSKTPAKIM